MGTKPKLAVVPVEPDAAGKPQRRPLPKSVRFEVFKRDRFACQYCGAKAPETLLHVDHIVAVANGGADEIVNLITACEACNLGKGAKRLEDSSAVEKQRGRLDDLEDRREQLEMMAAWRDSLVDLEEQSVKRICEFIARFSDTWVVSEVGRGKIRKWLIRHSPAELMAAAHTAFSQYYESSTIEEHDGRSWNKAFDKIPGVATVSKAEKEKPYLRDLFYAQGIIRRRFKWPRYQCIDLLEEAHLLGADLGKIKSLAKSVDDVDGFEKVVADFIEEHGSGR